MRDKLHLLLLALTSAVVRLVWIPCVATGGSHLKFFDPDGLYHMRQILHAKNLFPFMSFHDTYLHRPDGGPVPWPGGFDWLIASGLKILSLFGLAGTYSEEFAAAVLVSLLGLLTVFLVKSVASAVWESDAAGWCAAWLAAFSPVLIDNSRFGRVDHHVFEAAVLLLGLHPKIPPRWKGAILGIAVVLAQSMILPIGVAAGAMLVSEFFERARGEEPKELGVASAALVTSTPLIALVSWGHGIWFDYQTVNFFHSFLIALWWIVERLLNTRSWARGALFGGLTVAVAALVVLPAVASFSFMARNPVVSLISESRSPLRIGPLLLSYVTFNLFLWPAGLFLLWRNRRIPMVVACLAYMVLFIFQIRFLSHAAALISIASAGVLASLRPHLAGFFERPGGNPHLAGAIPAVLFGAWAVLSTGAFSKELFSPTCVQNPKIDAVFEMTDWIRTHTPDPGRAGAPEFRPRYRILAPWDLGHHLIYLAERAAVITPFIFDPSTPGLETSVRFFFLDDVETAFRRARATGVRYVLVPGLETEAVKESRIYDATTADRLRNEWKERRMVKNGSAYRGTMASKLVTVDRIETLSGEFRLIHEITWPGKTGIQRLRFFELIPRAD